MAAKFLFSVNGSGSNRSFLRGHGVAASPSLEPPSRSRGSVLSSCSVPATVALRHDAVHTCRSPTDQPPCFRPLFDGRFGRSQLPPPTQTTRKRMTTTTTVAAHPRRLAPPAFAARVRRQRQRLKHRRRRTTLPSPPKRITTKTPCATTRRHRNPKRRRRRRRRNNDDRPKHLRTKSSPTAIPNSGPTKWPLRKDHTVRTVCVPFCRECLLSAVRK